MSPDKEIILVDGSSFLFRAYHAMGRAPLSTSDGRTTQAIYGMINMLNSLLKECQPEYIAVVMDAKGKTFRHEMYSEYKANRPPMPDDLRQQLAYILKIIPALGIPLISVSGVEADDVIGTLACEATKKGFHTLIVSSDKDLAQLVNDTVIMVDTMKNQRLDVAGVVEKFGVPPNRIIDYLALMGDSSDNIPGIPKVGNKTAAKWINEFGSLESIIASADKISGKVGENLRANLDLLDLSRQLATIKCDVDLPYQAEQLCLQPRDENLLREYFSDLEFRSWLTDLNSDSHTQQEPVVTTYETILDQQTFDKWIEKITNTTLLSLDTETTSLDPHNAQLVGLSFSVQPNEAAYLPLGHDYTGVPQQLPFDATLTKLKPILEDESKKKTGQNLKYDMQVLQNHGIELRGIAHDTMLMSYIVNAGYSRHDMDTLAAKHLNRKTTKFSDIAGSGKNQLTFNQVDIEQASQYAAEDADIALQLHHCLLEEVQQHKGLQHIYNDIEIPLLVTLARTESNGVKINSELLAKQSADIAKRLAHLEQSAYDVSGEAFNISSPKQIQHILYEKQNLPILRKTPKGQPSTAEDTLQELAQEYELPKIIIEHRGLAKLKSTYTDKLPLQINAKTQRIHTSYHQAVAATGRLSSTNPNLQNIPIRTDEGKKIREAFIPEKNHVLIAADYSQIELRIMAHLSADQGLINAFKNDADIHSATAAEVFNCDLDAVTSDIRRRAKAINFGLIYGMSAFGLAKQLKIEQKQAKQYIEIYFDRYPAVKNYMEQIKEIAREQGYVETIFGRRLNLPDINAKNANTRQYAERTAINAPMQGSAADIIKMAMISLDNWLIKHDENSKIIMQVHDELVLETPVEEVEKITKITPKLMCGVTQLAVPLIVDVGIGHNWKEAH